MNHRGEEVTNDRRDDEINTTYSEGNCSIDDSGLRNCVESYEEGQLEEQEQEQEKKTYQDQDQEQRQDEVVEESTVESLYGFGKRYPEPYLAGKPPNELVHLRQLRKREGKAFVYAVRFRMGPLGLSFDNRVGLGGTVYRV